MLFLGIENHSIFNCQLKVKLLISLKSIGELFYFLKILCNFTFNVIHLFKK